MLYGMSKLMTGDLLKILCDMGHGDTIVIADANFPAERIAKPGRLVRMPGLDATTVLEAVMPLFPLDTYAETPAMIMDLTEGDAKEVAEGKREVPACWKLFDDALKAGEAAYGYGPTASADKIERFKFYDVAMNAYAVIQTGEERQYGNIILTKGCVL